MRNMLNNFGTIGNSTVRPIVKLNVCDSILRSISARLAYYGLSLHKTQPAGPLCLTLLHWLTGTSGLKPCVATCSVISEQHRRRPTMRRPMVD